MVDWLSMVSENLYNSPIRLRQINMDFITWNYLGLRFLLVDDRVLASFRTTESIFPFVQVFAEQCLIKSSQFRTTKRTVFDISLRRLWEFCLLISWNTRRNVVSPQPMVHKGCSYPWTDSIICLQLILCFPISNSWTFLRNLCRFRLSPKFRKKKYSLKSALTAQLGQETSKHTGEIIEAIHAFIFFIVRKAEVFHLLHEFFVFIFDFGSSLRIFVKLWFWFLSCEIEFVSIKLVKCEIEIVILDLLFIHMSKL